MLDQEFLDQKHLLKAAIAATDNYLAVEKKSIEAGFVSRATMDEFIRHMNEAKELLSRIGVLDDHIDYMNSHVETMQKLATHDVNESVEEIDEEAEKGLAAKAAKSGISVGTLRKVYNRGMAAWRTGHRPGTTPQQWAMARVNSYIMKGKGTYYGADKDLREEDEKEDISDEDLDKMANDLDWEDIVDFYDEEELVDSDEELDDDEEENKVNEALSQQARLKKKQAFARFKGRRNVAKGMKLRRASDVTTLQRRAKLAARRALYKRFLRGRDKSALSAAEKSRLEQQVANLKVIQNTLAQRMMPKIRSIEQKRLASYRTKK